MSQIFLLILRPRWKVKREVLWSSWMAKSGYRQTPCCFSKRGHCNLESDVSFFCHRYNIKDCGYKLLKGKQKWTQGKNNIFPYFFFFLCFDFYCRIKRFFFFFNFVLKIKIWFWWVFYQKRTFPILSLSIYIYN